MMAIPRLPGPLLLLGCGLLLLLLQMPGGVEGYGGHRGRLRANAAGAAGGDNYTCYHAPVQPGVRVIGSACVLGCGCD